MRVRSRSKIKLSSLLTVLAVIVFFLSNEENHVYSIRRGDDGVDDDFYDDDETDRHDRDNDRLETSPPTPLPSSTQRPSIGITAYPTNTPTFYPTKGPQCKETDFDKLEGDGNTKRKQLKLNVMTASLILNSVENLMANPVDLEFFKIPESAAHPTNYFCGSLNIDTVSSRWVQSSYEVHEDTELYSYNWRRLQLPEFSQGFVQHGSHFIPVNKSVQRVNHPYWEIAVGPGRVWDENSDRFFSILEQGTIQMTRASFPITLVEKNRDCTHNGVMMFMFYNSPRSGSVEVSNVAYEIVKETCTHFKLDLWGLVRADARSDLNTHYDKVFAKSNSFSSSYDFSSQVQLDYENEIHSRIPTRDISELGNNVGGITDISVFEGNQNMNKQRRLSTEETNLEEKDKNRNNRHIRITNGDKNTGDKNIGDKNIGAGDKNIGNNNKKGTLATMYGYYIDNVMYTGGFETRYGSYPYPESMIVPSSSLATTFFTVMVALSMEQEFGGIIDSSIGEVIPECPDSWNDVKIKHLLDMSSGHYLLDSNPWLDEEIFDYGFTSVDRHTTKLNKAFQSYTKLRAEPGTHWTYHTSDTYLVGWALQLLLDRQEVSEKYENLIHYLQERIMSPLNLSDMSKGSIRTTYDSYRQPLASHGMFLTLDDLMKLSRFINPGNSERGVISGKTILRPSLLDSALQLNSKDRGMAANLGSPLEPVLYKNSFWGHELNFSTTKCNNFNFIPTARSPSTGSVVALFPNNSTYIYISDIDVSPVVSAELPSDIADIADIAATYVDLYDNDYDDDVGVIENPSPYSIHDIALQVSAIRCKAEYTDIQSLSPTQSSVPTITSRPSISAHTFCPVTQFDELMGDGNVIRRNLVGSQLLVEDPSIEVSFNPIDLSEFALPDNAANPENNFCFSTMKINIEPEKAYKKFDKVYDRVFYSFDSKRKELPEIQQDFVQHGSHLIPINPGIQTYTNHPYWEVIVGNGRVWNEIADGNWTRASFPFTLIEKNKDCSHNGVMMFLFSSMSGSLQVSNVAYQIAQETCSYFKANYWGMVRASVESMPRTDENENLITASKEKYVQYSKSIIEKKPITNITADFYRSPVSSAEQIDPTKFGQGAGDDLTMFAYMIDDIAYVGGFETRYGSYPYPDSMVVPLGKMTQIFFTSLIALSLDHEYGNIFKASVGENLKDQSDLVEDGIPETFDSVSLKNLLDMSSGHYKFKIHNVDEDTFLNSFYDATGHKVKLSEALDTFNRRSPPGRDWVYHGSDYYLGGTVLRKLLKDKTGSDDLGAYVYDKIYEPLALSESSKNAIQKTYDAFRQPLGSTGLFLNLDDILKLSRFFNPGYGKRGKSSDGEYVLRPHFFETLVQNNPRTRGYEADDNLYYSLGMWGKKIGNAACENMKYIPFTETDGPSMITLFPNNSTYIEFTDTSSSGSAFFNHIAHEVSKIRCETTTGYNDSPTVSPTITAQPTSYSIHHTDGNNMCFTTDYDFVFGSGETTRSALGLTQLRSFGKQLTKFNLLEDYSDGFTIPSNASHAGNNFCGTLVVSPDPRLFWDAEIHTDKKFYGNTDGRKKFPAFSQPFVQHGSHLIPIQDTRGLEVSSSNPYWDVIVGSGRVWDEVSDQSWSRASFPVTLVEKNNDCTHNGVMMFLFRNPSSMDTSKQTISNIAYQITQETCVHYQVDMWGMMKATYNEYYLPRNIDPSNVQHSFEIEKQNRLPTKHISELSSDFGSSVKPSSFGVLNDSEKSTMFAFMMNETAYIGDFMTRSGNYPYPESMVVPSDSIAKTLLGTITTLAMQGEFEDIMDKSFSSMNPSSIAPGSWHDVTISNLIDMSTGHYTFSQHLRDDSINSDSFNGLDQHLDKLEEALSYKRNSLPGQRFVYHSSDIYLLGWGLNMVLKNERKTHIDSSEDSGFDLLSYYKEKIMDPLHLSSIAKNSIRVTRDSFQQPIFTSGMFLTMDDVLKLSVVIHPGSLSRGSINGEQVLDSDELEKSLQYTDTDRGFLISEENNIWYNNGIWAKEMNFSECSAYKFVPFAFGAGPSIVALYPNNSTFVYFSDFESSSLRSFGKFSLSDEPTNKIDTSPSEFLSIFDSAAEEAANILCEATGWISPSPTFAPTTTFEPTLPKLCPVSYYNKLSGNGEIVRNRLTSEMLRREMSTSKVFPSMVDFVEFKIPENGAHPSNFFCGTLHLTRRNIDEDMEVIEDPIYGTSEDRKSIPAFSVSFVQHGSHLLPTNSGLRVIPNNIFWEIIIGAGRVWDEMGDEGWSRASFPITLVPRNDDCAHNGVMMFLFKSSGEISSVAYQITEETCGSFKADFWGMMGASFSIDSLMEEISQVDPLTLRSDYELEVSNRIPKRDILQIASDIPGVDVTKFGGDYGMTMFAFDIDNTAYVGGFQTRSGTYPYPESMVVPSGSIAKTLFGAVSALTMEQEFGNIMSASIGNTISGISSKWNTVQLRHALDMTTGFYFFSSYGRDDNTFGQAFDIVEDHQSKIDVSLKTYPRKRFPGNTWVYHSSDVYIVGTMLRIILKQNTGSNDLVGYINDRVFKPLGLSSIAQGSIRTTYDDKKQPYATTGMFLTLEDVIKLSRLLNPGNPNRGKIGDTQVLNLNFLNSMVQLNSGSRGKNAYEDFYFQHGTWAKNYKAPTCANFNFVPFAKSSSPSLLALFPNGSSFTFFADDDETIDYEASLDDAVVETSLIKCNGDIPSR